MLQVTHNVPPVPVPLDPNHRSGRSACPFCRERFATKFNCSRHISAKHHDVIFTPINSSQGTVLTTAPSRIDTANPFLWSSNTSSSPPFSTLSQSQGPAAESSGPERGLHPASASHTNEAMLNSWEAYETDYFRPAGVQPTSNSQDTGPANPNSHQVSYQSTFSLMSPPLNSWPLPQQRINLHESFEAFAVNYCKGFSENMVINLLESPGTREHVEAKSFHESPVVLSLPSVKYAKIFDSGVQFQAVQLQVVLTQTLVVAVSPITQPPSNSTSLQRSAYSESIPSASTAGYRVEDEHDVATMVMGYSVEPEILQPHDCTPSPPRLATANPDLGSVPPPMSVGNADEDAPLQNGSVNGPPQRIEVNPPLQKIHGLDIVDDTPESKATIPNSPGTTNAPTPQMLPESNIVDATIESKSIVGTTQVLTEEPYTWPSFFKERDAWYSTFGIDDNDRVAPLGDHRVEYLKHAIMWHPVLGGTVWGGKPYTADEEFRRQKFMVCGRAWRALSHERLPLILSSEGDLRKLESELRNWEVFGSWDDLEGLFLFTLEEEFPSGWFPWWTSLGRKKKLLKNWRSLTKAQKFDTLKKASERISRVPGLKLRQADRIEGPFKREAQANRVNEALRKRELHERMKDFEMKDSEL